MRPSTTRCASTCCAAKGSSKQKAQKNEMLSAKPSALPVVQASKFELVTEVCYPFGRKHGRHRAVKRRQFITLLGGAAAAWPVGVRAQQPERKRRIGVLMGSEQSDPDSQVRLAAFRQVLRQLGWTEGRNIQIDERWGAVNPETLRTYVAELVGSAPDAVLAHTAPVVAAVKRETRTVPIVFVMVPAPVEIGLV